MDKRALNDCKGVGGEHAAGALIRFAVGPFPVEQLEGKKIGGSVIHLASHIYMHVH